MLDVSASGYYDWRDREPSARALDNALLSDRIEQIHGDSKAIYGEPRFAPNYAMRACRSTMQSSQALVSIG